MNKKYTIRKKAENYAFVDGQNLNLGIQELGWKLDFQRFRVYLKEKYGVSTAYYFIGKVAGNEELYDAIKNAGYILIYKEVLTDPYGKAKGNIDAELVLQAMTEYTKYDKAVIVSGDGDFACLVSYLNNKNKLARVIVPNIYRYSALLKKAAAKRLDSMNDLKRKLAYNFSYKKTADVNKPAFKKQMANKPRTKKQPTQKQHSGKPTGVTPVKPKTFFKKFRYPRKKTGATNKPTFKKQPTQNQTSDKPTTTTPSKRKPFFKFRFRRRPPFKKRTP